MNVSSLANIAEIVGAVVVVISLIYLAIQIRQNNELLRSESRRAMMQNEQTAMLLAFEHQEVLRKLNESSELSAKEQFELSIIFILDMENRAFEYRQFKNGVLDEQTWLDHQHVIVENHASVRGRKWWNNVGKEFYNQEFVNLVDDWIRDKDST
ncbi:MAG: hypothetical protein ACR2QR_03105, partial [Woeseiaceae bacterium]